MGVWFDEVSDRCQDLRAEKLGDSTIPSQAESWVGQDGERDQPPPPTIYVGRPGGVRTTIDGVGGQVNELVDRGTPVSPGS